MADIFHSPKTYGDYNGCYGGMSYHIFRNYSNSDPAPSAPMARSETAKEKRDRLSKEENKRSLEASRHGGKRKF